jgi:hypothetical protein
MKIAGMAAWTWPSTGEEASESLSPLPCPARNVADVPLVVKGRVTRKRLQLTTSENLAGNQVSVSIRGSRLLLSLRCRKL